MQTAINVFIIVLIEGRLGHCEVFLLGQLIALRCCRPFARRRRVVAIRSRRGRVTVFTVVVMAVRRVNA